MREKKTFISVATPKPQKITVFKIWKNIFLSGQQLPREATDLSSWFCALFISIFCKNNNVDQTL